MSHYQYYAITTADRSSFTVRIAVSDCRSLQDLKQLISGNTFNSFRLFDEVYSESFEFYKTVLININHIVCISLINKGPID